MKKKRINDFQNFEVDPSPGLWKKIETELPGKKKRRFLFFWLMTAFVASVAGIYLGLDKEKNVPVVSHVENRNQNNSHREMAVETSLVNKVFIASNDNTFIDLNKKTPEKNIVIKENRIQKKTKNKFASPTIASAQAIESTPIENNQKENDFIPPTMEGLDFLSPISVQFNIETEKNISDKSFGVKNKNRLSRWSIYFGGLISESDFKSFEDTTDEYTQDIRGLTTKSFAGGINFDISTHFRVSLGMTSIDKGQVRSGVSTIILKGPPGNSNIVTISTPLGDITGTSNDFNTNFTATGDTLPFIITSSVAGPNSAPTDSIATKSFSLSEKFSYTEFPLMITYRMSERRITPFGGILFSPSYLSSHTILINGNELNYDYEDKLVKWNYSIGVVAGFDIKLSRRFSVYMNGFYQKNQNSITNGENKWKPKVLGCNGGLSFRL